MKNAPLGSDLLVRTNGFANAKEYVEAYGLHVSRIEDVVIHRKPDLNGRRRYTFIVSALCSDRADP